MCLFSTFTTFLVAGHRLVRPHERSLEPFTETDGDETMMDNPGDDDAGETAAVKSKIVDSLPWTWDSEPKRKTTLEQRVAPKAWKATDRSKAQKSFGGLPKRVAAQVQKGVSLTSKFLRRLGAKTNGQVSKHNGGGKADSSGCPVGKAVSRCH